MAKWNPKDVNVIINGIIATGFGEDTMISISPNTEKHSVTVGADGQKDININPNDTVTATITLKQNSATNNVLLGLYKSSTPFAFAVEDLNNGASKVVGTECYANLADNSKETELPTREWEIIVLNYQELSI